MNVQMTASSGAKVASWAGVIGIVIGAAFILFVPKPTTASVFAMKKKQEATIQSQADRAQSEFKDSQKEVVARTWSGGAEDVGPGALNEMNALATKYKVKLSGFRPERPTQDSGLDFLPFSVTATGAYLDLLNFVKAIENPDNKLAVDSLQIASSEANSDQVIGTIGITAYQVSQETQHV